MAVYDLPGRDVGLASDWLCLAEIDDTLSGAELCRALVHEFGHLAGHDHSTDPLSIMFSRVTNVPYEPCEDAARRVEPVAAHVVAAWWIIDGMRRGTRVHCQPSRRAPTTVRCGVRDRWGKLKQWRVRVTGTAYGDVALG